MQLGRRMGQEDAAEGEVARYLEEQRRQKAREQQPGGMLSEPGDPEAVAHAKRHPIATAEARGELPPPGPGGMAHPGRYGMPQGPHMMPDGAMMGGTPAAQASPIAQSATSGAPPSASPAPVADESTPPWMQALMGGQQLSPPASDPAYQGAPLWLQLLSQYLLQQKGPR